MTLILMRHAEAEHGKPDRLRVLTDTGRKEAAARAMSMAAHAVPPEYIITSTARRTQETADLVTQTLRVDAPVHRDETLYTGNETDYLPSISRVHESFRTVLLIGHNPTISLLATLFAGYSVPFSPAEAVYCRLPVDTWAELALSGSDRVEVLHL